MTARSKNLLILALALAMFLAAVEGTIVTLAIPTIAKDLSGFDLISWVFSAYLFASAVSTPIFGKLCDLFGRKRMLIIGILIFIIGSASCGLSQSMHMLIAFRVLQGIGAGAIFTVPSTIVGDTFPLDQRGKVQGALSVVWGIASLVGPFLGGMLIAVLSWHWIFFINVPIGLVSVIVLQRVFDEQFERRRQPIIPHGIFNSYSNMINLTAFAFSAALIGLDVYLPIYLQNVRGLSPLLSGLLILPMSLSWLIASTISGRAILRWGIKKVLAGYSLVALVFTLPTLFFNGSIPFALVGLTIFFIGFGFGGSFVANTMAIQESASYEKRGMAVSLNSLLRTLGQTISISIFGLLFNAAIIQGFNAAGILKYNLADLYNLAAYTAGTSWSQVATVLANSLHGLYLVVVVLLVVTLVLTLLIPRPRCT